MILEAELLFNLRELKNYHKLEILMSYYKKSPIEMLDDILGKLEINVEKEEIKWTINLKIGWITSLPLGR